MTKKNKNIPPKHGEIVIYATDDREARLEVKLEEETVWLTQKQIAELFKTERSVITKHLNNIFNTNELVKERNVQKMHIPFSDKPVSFYNLDVIISVGYRVNSKRATQFRIWATKVLKDHPFVDGNKRIGSFLFILFLHKNNYLLKSNGEAKINDNTLVALALLIAESKPKEKEVMIALITNLLNEY